MAAGGGQVLVTEQVPLREERYHLLYDSDGVIVKDHLNIDINEINKYIIINII